MNELIAIALLIAFWVVLKTWILPKMGVNT